MKPDLLPIVPGCVAIVIGGPPENVGKQVDVVEDATDYVLKRLPGAPGRWWRCVPKSPLKASFALSSRGRYMRRDMVSKNKMLIQDCMLLRIGGDKNAESRGDKRPVGESVSGKKGKASGNARTLPALQK